jgi:hypothetical protein
MKMKMMELRFDEQKPFALHQPLVAHEVVGTEEVDDTKDKTASSFQVRAVRRLQHGLEPA